MVAGERVVLMKEKWEEPEALSAEVVAVADVAAVEAVHADQVVEILVWASHETEFGLIARSGLPDSK